MSDLEQSNRNSDRHPSLRPLLHRRLPSQASSTAHLPASPGEEGGPGDKDPGPLLPVESPHGPLGEPVTALYPLAPQS